MRNNFLVYLFLSKFSNDDIVIYVQFQKRRVLFFFIVFVKVEKFFFDVGEERLDYMKKMKEFKFVMFILEINYYDQVIVICSLEMQCRLELFFFGVFKVGFFFDLCFYR